MKTQIGNPALLKAHHCLLQIQSQEANGNLFFHYHNTTNSPVNGSNKTTMSTFFIFLSI